LIKKKKIKFSIISPAIRTENWLKIYNSVISDNISFEMIFAGPRKPNFKLPRNFKYIKTNVKPAQCWEILYKKARGKYIMNIGDDYIFKTEKPLKILSRELSSIKEKKILLGLRYIFRNIDQTKMLTIKINNNETESELLPMSPPLKKKLWYKYGRFDSRFICTLMDGDFFLRMVKDGYKVKHSAVIISEEEKLEDNRKMSRDYMRLDQKLIIKLWTKKVKDKLIFTKERNEPVKNYKTKTLMAISEEPCGRWNNNNKIYNLIITSRVFYYLNIFYYARLRLYKIKKYFT